MDFQLPDAVNALRDRIRKFVDTRLIPLESEQDNFDAHGNLRLEMLRHVREEARQAGLWALQMPPERGGGGLSMTAMAACYEEMNRSIFGPVCFNSAAPDDGNMMVLNKIGTEAQKSRWLQPIIDGEVFSAFSMTEPAPGSGSDPAGMMRTRAERHGDRWVVNGHKWFITGAEVAEHFIVIARTSDDPRRGLTAFIHHRDDPGWHIRRRIPILGPEEHGGHCELIYDGLEIPDDQVLMGEGLGLKVTQIRLGPARLTHCMRWMGLARRAMEIAADYVADRQAFGQPLQSIESVQQMLGNVALRIEVARLLTMKAAWCLDQGSFARAEISAAKITASEVLHEAVDTAIQLCGARGYSTDTPLEWMYRYARQARLVDGSSEVHRMVLSRAFLERRSAFWRWSAD